MRNIKVYLICMFLLLSIGLVQAQLSSLGVFKQNQQVRIAQICSGATYINISSITYPNSTNAVSNIIMTSAGSGEYYYVYTSTPTLGRYDVRGISDGCEGEFATYFDVTPAGVTNNPNFYYLVFALSMGIIIFGFAIKNGWIAVLGSFGLVYLGLYILLYGINGIKDTVYTWGLGIILLAVASYIGIKSSYEMIEDM